MLIKDKHEAKTKTVFEQVRNNLVAIISLMAAIGGFMFDTWRDQQNEINQNMREAAFEVLKDLGELQTIVNYAHFESDANHGNPIEGWKYAIQVKDLSHLLNAQTKQQGQTLFEVWEAHWPNLNTDPASEQVISKHIRVTIRSVLKNIYQLN